MTNSNNIKLQLMKALIDTEDPDILARAKALLIEEQNLSLTAEQKKLLDIRKKREENSQAKDYSLEDVKTIAREEALSK